MIKRLASSLLLVAALPLAAHAAISVSIDIAPPALPVYVQPVIPSPGYIWTPGYWRWDPAGADYFWVPGTWIAPPYVGALWTPGYWGWGGGGYRWHGGYWGTHVGFYGGINYGFGYVGHGYQGGYWNGGVFSYNRSVNNINTTIVHNTYNTTVVNNNTRVSFNGGQGGVAARPTNDERAARAEPHTAPTQPQRQHEQVAMRTPEQRAAMNHGTPAFASTPHAGDMHGERGGPNGAPGGSQGGGLNGGRPSGERGERGEAMRAAESPGGRPPAEMAGERGREPMGDRGPHGGGPRGEPRGGERHGGGRERER